MENKNVNDPDRYCEVPLEPPPEGDPVESVDTDLPGPGGGAECVTPGAQQPTSSRVAEARRRQELAELGLPIDEGFE